MKKLLFIIFSVLLIGGCRVDHIPSDPDYPIGTIVYIMPDSTKAVACGGFGLGKDSPFLWVQYTSKFGKLETESVNKQLIYK